MDLRDIQYVLEVASQKSFSKAAGLLYITQSALSQRINHIEDEIGVKLFVRSTRSVSITPAGQVFVTYAERVMDSYHELNRALNAYAEKKRHNIRIGLFSQAEYSVFPTLIAGFIAGNPRFHVNISIVNEQELVSGVLDDTLDFSFIRCYPNNLPDQIMARPLFSDPIYVLLHKDDPLAAKDEITRQEIEKYQLICEKNGMTNTYESLCGDFSKEALTMSPPHIYINSGSMLPSLITAPGCYFFTTEQSSANLCKRFPNLQGRPLADSMPATAFMLLSKDSPQDVATLLYTFIKAELQ